MSESPVLPSSSESLSPVVGDLSSRPRLTHSNQMCSLSSVSYTLSLVSLVRLLWRGEL